MALRRIKSDDFAKLFPEIKSANKMFNDLEKLRVSKKLPIEEFDSVIEDFRIDLNKSEKVQTGFNENQGAYLYKVLVNRINKYFNLKINKSKREVIADDKQIQTESNNKTWREREDKRNFNEWTKETLEELGTVLKPLEIEIIKLIIFEGYPYKEIVVLIENKFQGKYSEENLRKIFSRSVKQLRNHPGIEGMLQFISNGLLFDKDKIEKILIQTGIENDASKELTKEFEEMCISSKVAINPFEVLCDVLLSLEKMPKEFKNEGNIDDYIWILLAANILDKIRIKHKWDGQFKLNEKRLDKINTEENRIKFFDFLTWMLKNLKTDKASESDLISRLPNELKDLFKTNKINIGGNLLRRIGH